MDRCELFLAGRINKKITVGVTFHKPYLKHIPEVIQSVSNCSANMRNIDLACVASDVTSQKIKQLETAMRNSGVQAFIYPGKKTSAEARNIIIQASESPWVAFFDGDSLPAEDYFCKLEQIVSGEHSDTIGAFAGWFTPIEESRFGKYEFLEDKNSFLYFLNENNRFIKMFQGGNCVLKRDVLKKLAGLVETCRQA